jgi:hypothetical protein
MTIFASLKFVIILSQPETTIETLYYTLLDNVWRKAQVTRLKGKRREDEGRKDER